MTKNIPEYHKNTAIGLINVFKVRPGYGLAALLGVPDQYDNHRAVSYWVDNQANNDGTIYTDSKRLQKRFRSLLESHGYYFEDLVIKP